MGNSANTFAREIFARAVLQDPERWWKKLGLKMDSMTRADAAIRPLWNDQKEACPRPFAFRAKSTHAWLVHLSARQPGDCIIIVMARAISGGVTRYFVGELAAKTESEHCVLLAECSYTEDKRLEWSSPQEVQATVCPCESEDGLEFSVSAKDFFQEVVYRLESGFALKA